MSEWIKCSDRLPEDRQKVLARILYYTDYPTFRDFTDFITVLRFTKRCGGYWEADSNYNLEQVTHWMPLPPPPTEGK
jgi:hypothetical protein